MSSSSVALRLCACATLLLLVAPGPARCDEVLADLVERVAPSVVNLHTAGLRDPQTAWDALFGGPRRFESLGSGFVVDADKGWIVTNAHVVGEASEIRVGTADGALLRAEVVGADAGIDLALLQVDGLALPAVRLGSSEELRVGEDLFAVGNPYGHGHTVTRGILSARSRSLGRDAFDLFLQTDAAINPGNSGGPVFDAEGRVVGVATAVDGRGEALAFALPVEMVRGALPFLQRGARVVPGWSGLRLEEGERGGLAVAAVYPGTPASKAGLRPGDRVLEIDGRPVRGRASWAEALGAAFPGDTRSLMVARGERALPSELRLVDRDAWASALVGPPRPVDAFYVAVSALAPDHADMLGLRAGAMVVEARRGSFFAPGDIILQVNGAPIEGPSDLEAVAPTVLRARYLDAIVRRNGNRIRLAHRW